MFRKHNKVKVKVEEFIKEKHTPFNLRLNPHLGALEWSRKRDIDDPNSRYNQILNRANFGMVITITSASQKRRMINAKFEDGFECALSFSVIEKI